MKITTIQDTAKLEKVKEKINRYQDVLTEIDLLSIDRFDALRIETISYKYRVLPSLKNEIRRLFLDELKKEQARLESELLNL